MNTMNRQTRWELTLHSRYFRKRKPIFASKPRHLATAQCLSSHANCESTIKPSLPTRLLDLGGVGRSQDVIRLVESDTIPERHHRYTILSHCWGSLELPKTIISSRAQNSDPGIMVSLLPKTFQNAITITRALSLRYLWIDSLCIIQDDESDWQHEASRMSSYYQNSHLTIAATSAHDAHRGLFLETVNSSLYLAKDADEGLVAARLHIPHPEEWLRLRSPLTSRVWVLQEEILSVRTIHCMTEQWFWKCRIMEESEDGAYQMTTTNRILTPTVSGPCTERENDMYRWMEIAAEYSRRHLTYEKDRLPALSGITDFYQHQMKDKPLLGAWISTIAYDLGWKVSYPENSDSSEIVPRVSDSIPSWSWFSRLTQHRRLGCIWFDYFVLDHSQKGPRSQLTKAVECDVVWSGQSMTSQLLSASLVVEGPATTRRSLPSTHISDPQTSTEVCVSYDDRKTMGEDNDTELVLFLWNATIQSDDALVTLVEQSLLLEIVEKEPLTCRRIGIESRLEFDVDQSTLPHAQFLSLSNEVPVKRIRLI
ncbi:heterokaryon incompatibility protein-domain-containing protein [Podospora fimiseda]|uniref:Heterokaryon incompatibility protein-domain-containing protein n=1 Tax=Podospora fimiseda TaxID=252190 RepID=A0AAN7BGA5_9PEZI|nr:heterokaryon incompatibility protein-domain-containing protein [Podospora fimiseda]